jgi:sigma-54 specific flagellar transcriptional regulator A
MTAQAAIAATAEALLIGDSPAIVDIRRLVRQVAPSSASVIVTGPSGSGKEMVARAIHAESDRSTQPYVAVNCGAIPRDLLESDLFGHEKGSFTGAINQRRGRFEEAHGGTLFLDEIGDMPADMQVKLLRVLEERAVERIGGRGPIAIDARIISATHRDIEEAIGAQRFREDLFYRLAVFPIHLPSLAERREDVPLLIRHFLRRSGWNASIKFAPAAMDRLVAHNWPGNVRELRNVIERAAILYQGQTISAEQVDCALLPRVRRNSGERAAVWEASTRAVPPAPLPANVAALTDGEDIIGDENVDLRMIVADLEHRYISEALRKAGGVVAEAARSLSLQRTTLIEKMRKYGLAKEAA